MNKNRHWAWDLAVTPIFLLATILQGVLVFQRVLFLPNWVWSTLDRLFPLTNYTTSGIVLLCAIWIISITLTCFAVYLRQRMRNERYFWIGYGIYLILVYVMVTLGPDISKL